VKNVKEIEIKLEKEWIEAIDKVFKKKNKETKIDGFRKGTAPKEIFMQKVGIETLYMDAINEVMNDAYKKAVVDNKLEPVVEPGVDIIGVSDTNVIIKFTIITKPKIELGEYKNLKVEKNKIEVTDKEIEEEIENLKKRHADLVVKEEGKITKGDTAVIDFEGFVDGKPLDGGTGTNFPLEIGSNSFIPGFEEGLIGLGINDKKKLNLKFPNDYVEHLKNKDVEFDVTIKEIKTKVFPELNSEFFEDLGYENIKTIEDLKEKIKNDIKVEKENRENERFINACLEKIIANMKVEINEEIIEDEIHRLIDRFANELKMYGMNIDTYYEQMGMSHEKMHETMRPQAENNVKSRYVLESIAEKEKFEVTKEEIKDRYEEMAKMYGVELKEVKNVYSDKLIEYDVKMRKALDFIKENN